MKVDIIYRCCGKETGASPVLAGRPPWFSKLKCFDSIMRMVRRMPNVFSIHVIYDGPHSPLYDHIQLYKPDSIIGSNVNSTDSIDLQWSVADNLTGDYIYFCEDDYLHTCDAATVFLEGAQKFHLITLYDHLDRYTRTDDITAGRESVSLTKSCHWRTAESTTCTWGCDRRLWSAIKMPAIKCRNNDRVFFRNLIQVGIRLWTPMPPQSTHCVTGYISPLINWEGVSRGL